MYEYSHSYAWRNTLPLCAEWPMGHREVRAGIEAPILQGHKPNMQWFRTTDCYRGSVQKNHVTGPATRELVTPG